MPRSFILRTPAGNVLMEEAIYSTEALFQDMLAKTNEVLSGDQINPAAPRRWLLVSREMPIPDSDSGANRWSVDHLFLDQDGIPTFVEIKRSSDSRIRREVVGQMLDYAANAVVYWPVEIIRERLEAVSKTKERSVDEMLTEFLGPENDDDSALDAFWEKVHLNLRAGKIRMIFVADSIPPELQRIIEFLNEQMNPAEVLGLEVRLHSGGNGYELLVPSLIGRTAEAQAVKASPTSQRQLWDESRFYIDMAERLGEKATDTVREIVSWLQENGLEVRFGGQGKSYGSIVPIFRHNTKDHRPFVIYGDGAIEIRFSRIKDSDPFSSNERMLALMNRLNALSGSNWGLNNINTRPSFRLEKLYDRRVLERFFEVWTWYLDTIRTHSSVEMP